MTTPSSTTYSLDCPPQYATRRTDRPTLGGRVAEVANLLGTPLMPWQRYVADVALEIDPDTGQLAYREVILTVPRQSGKTTLLLAVMVHRAIGFGNRQRITYTAQTRSDARRKWQDEHLVILNKSPLADLYDIRLANGSEALIWNNGSIYSIASVTEKSGHGDTLDLGVIDEAFAQTDDRLEQAFKPAMITRTQPQLWITSTAGTAESVYLNGKVDNGRALVENTSGVAYFEWSADPDADASDPATWYSCMPALGHTITEQAIAADRMSMKKADFRRAYLNLRYERSIEDPVISDEAWVACKDERSNVLDPIAIAVDVSPNRMSASIAISGLRDDGRTHVEVIDNRIGTNWLPGRIEELVKRWSPCAVVIDSAGAAATMIPILGERGITVQMTTTRQVAQACGLFYDLVVNDNLRHRGQLVLDTAVAGAKRRPLGEAWAWHRKDMAIDISSLVASTLAVWAHAYHRSEAANNTVASPQIIDPWSTTDA
jgi:hypothetical protein